MLELIDQIKSLGDGPAWKNEDTTISDLDIASAKEISTWINRVIKVLPFCTTLVTDWGSEGGLLLSQVDRVHVEQANPTHCSFGLGCQDWTRTRTLCI